MNNYATYLRVSTQKQGKTMLGIDAQRKMCSDFISQHNGEHLQEFMDVESGTHRDRKGLWDAITFCQKNKCSLVIAKLDRLARDVEFTFKVINTGIDIHFTDMPVVNSMILGVFASVAQYEREMCSSRTKAALAVKKKQGVKLGGSNEKYQENYNKLTDYEKSLRNMKKGELKRQRQHEKPEFIAFKRIIQRVYPEYAASDDVKRWKWGRISMRGENKEKVFQLMRDYQDFDQTGRLFAKFDFENNIGYCEKRIHSYFQSFRRSCIETTKTPIENYE